MINATGYGARALFGDQSIIPVRGQLTRMIPQADVSYGLFYKNVSFVPRRDGLVFKWAATTMTTAITTKPRCRIGPKPSTS